MPRHSFAVAAYGESPYVRACLESLQAQTLSSDIVIATSTPNRAIAELASEFNAALIIGQSSGGIASDWNRALTAPTTSLVTVAHQDDLYHPRYAESAVGAIDRVPGALLAFTGFDELCINGARAANINLRIKRAMTALAFAGSDQIDVAWRKRALLALGNPICCPSVCFNRDAIPDFRFSDRFRSNLDWEAWAELADRNGSFVHLRQKLVSHRVHPASETSRVINDRSRDREDRAMLDRFWPQPAAALLARFYRLSYHANRT